MKKNKASDLLLAVAALGVAVLFMINRGGAISAVIRDHQIFFYGHGIYIPVTLLEFVCSAAAYLIVGFLWAASAVLAYRDSNPKSGWWFMSLMSAVILVNTLYKIVVIALAVSK